jgi:hypothetical protein
MSRLGMYYQEYPISLAPGEIQNLGVSGSTFGALAISGSNVLVRLGDAEEFPLRQGLIIEMPEGERFPKVQLRNNSLSSAQITFAVSEGKIRDNRFSTTVALKTYAGDKLIDSDKVNVTSTATIIKAADAVRTSIMIQNKSLTDSVWIGGSTVDAANNRGIELVVGAAITLNTSGVVYGRCLAGKNADVSILEIDQ